MPRAPDTYDKRPPKDQYYDKNDPIPEYELPDLFSSKNVPPDQIPQKIQDVKHNKPDQGERDTVHGKDHKDPPKEVVDPVIVFTGQYTITITDIQIPSRGFPIQLVRVYRSGAVYYGPWGYNWDHNYNVYLRELTGGGIAIWTGNISEDVYQLLPDGSYVPPLGVFLKLERNDLATLGTFQYVLSDLEGMKQVFEIPDGWPLSDRIPVVRIEDRQGNFHNISYDSEGRINLVEDHAGRHIKFTFGDCGLLSQLEDHIGRMWKYGYDQDIEHLISVTTPATNQYPSGLATKYEYDRFRQHPALIHNITKVTDPSGNVIVENTYGDDPSTDDFGRVVYQEFGGYVATFQTTFLQYVPQIPENINVEAWRVEVIDPGVLHVFTFNYRGDLLDERYRLVFDGSYRVVAKNYQYDCQGNIIELRQPNGLGVIAEYDSTNDDSRARGNLLRLTFSAPITKPAPSREILKCTYEPRYQHVKTICDEGGDVTNFIYDYEISTVNQGNIVTIEHSPTTLPDGTIQNSSEHFTYNTFGQIIERHSGRGNIFSYDYYDSGPLTGYLKRTIGGKGVENQSQEFNYDLYGNLAEVREASKLRIKYEWNALGQIVRIFKAMIDGSEGEVAYNYGPNGRLKSQDLPRGSFDDGVISDSYIRNEFEIDDLGYINIAIFGSNTAKPRRWSFDRNAEGFPTVVHDPLGQVTHLEYDERNLLLSQTLFSGTTEERTNQFGYDHNGNLIRYVDTAGLQTDYDYDSWDRLGDSVLPGINGSRTHVHSIYGLKDQIKRMETIGIPAPGATPTVLQEQDNQYDQRGRLVLRKQSGLTTTIWYDEDSCPTKSIDHRGNVNSYNCDALGRIILTQDQLGNLIIYIFDTNGNLTTLEEKEIEPGSSTPKIYKTNLIYDDRNRLIQLNDSLGNTVKTKYDDRDLIVAGTTELGIRNEYEYDLEGEFVVARGFVAQPTLKVEHRWERDLLSRVTKYTDPEGKSTQYDYNAEARWKKISLADGSSQQRIFDNAGRLSKEVRSSGISSEYSYGSDGLIDRIRFNTIPGVKPVPDINYERDGMGRVVNASQGATTIKLQYDSLGRLLSEAMAGITTQWKFDDHNGFAELAYPDGRVDRYEYDALGRVSRITLQRIAPQSPLTGNSFTAGSLLAGYEYVGPQRIHARTLGNGCITHYSYDQGRRLSGIEHLTKGGNILALVQYVYDSAGRRKVMRAEPSPGTSYIFDYDSLSRLSSVKEGFSAPSIPSNLDQLGSDNYVSALGSTSMLRKTRFDLDLADSPKSSISIGQAGSTVDNFVTDEVHKIRQITRTTPNASSTQTFSHDDDGNRVKDHNFTYVYDAIGRLREIRNLATNEVLFTQDFDPLGRATNTTIRNGISENHRYLGVRLVEDETSGGNVLRQYCMGIQLGEYISKSEGGEVWGHQDARLSLLAVSDNSGNPVERYSYSTFGMPSIWSSDGMVIRDKSNVRISPIFGGHNSIGLKGIYDARARIYDADTGYFLQRDPRGYINSANPYSYVSHNPIDFIDPTGEILPVIAAIVILGAVSGGGYSVYDSYHHPELYEGWSILKGFSNTVIGAVIGAASGLGGEAVLGAAGTGSLVGTGSVTAASTLTLSQSMALTGTVSATSGLIWRSGFNGLFPEYVEPPSIESSGFDFALGAVGPIIGRTMETASVQVWNSVRTGLNSVRTGVTNIVRGPWRPFGNTWKLLLNPRTKYNPLNLIWDDRTRNAVSKQYWRSTANGNSLQHLWVMESTRWVRQGIRSAGLNLIEVPLSYNRWMSNIPARNYAFRFGVASVLTATATGSGILTYKTLDYWTSNRDVNQTKGVDGMDTISNIPGNTSSNVSSPTKTSGTTFSDK